jgi:hypothetical protein
MSTRRGHTRIQILIWSSIAALLIAFGLAAVAKAEREKAAIVATPLVAMPIAPPNPVFGSDDKIHLAYELVLMNMARARSRSKRSRRSTPKAGRSSARSTARVSPRCFA